MGQGAGADSHGERIVDSLFRAALDAARAEGVRAFLWSVREEPIWEYYGPIDMETIAKFLEYRCGGPYLICDGFEGLSEADFWKAVRQVLRDLARSHRQWLAPNPVQGGEPVTVTLREIAEDAYEVTY